MVVATGETHRSERGMMRPRVPYDGSRPAAAGPSLPLFGRGWLSLSTSDTAPSESLGMSRIKQAHVGTTSAVSDGWVAGGSFFSSILAGTLLGWGLDTWLGTDPVLVVIGIVLGSVAGFYRMWEQVAKAPNQGKQDIFDGR